MEDDVAGMVLGVFVLVSTEWPDVTGRLQVLLTPLTWFLKENPHEEQDLHLIYTGLLQIGQPLQTIGPGLLSMSPLAYI